MTTTVELDPVYLLFAFRYALGRRTYAPSMVGGALIVHVESLRPEWRKQIVDEIDQAIAGGFAGDRCDVETWQDVRDFMAARL